MPEDTGGGEKTEEATPKKRQQARDEGQVAFSTEVNTIGLLLVGFATLVAFAPAFYQAIAGAIRLSMSEYLERDLSDLANLSLVLDLHTPVLSWMLALLGVMFLTGLILSLAQVGLHFTLKPLVPKASRISPMSGFKRIFSLRGMMRTIFSVAKLVLIISVAWWILSTEMVAQLYYNLDPQVRFAELMWLLLLLAFKMVAVLALVAAGDFLYQRFQHNKDMMMTKQEVKEEFKQSDGDPMIKAKIRQIQRQMAQQRMMQEVPSADVVITNPTHVAVALRYERAGMDAPRVVAKGYDLIAQRIKRIADEHGVVLVENVPLARALAKQCDIDDPIPTDFYQQVAEILSYVYRLKQQAL